MLSGGRSWAAGKGILCDHDGCHVWQRWSLSSGHSFAITSLDNVDKAKELEEANGVFKNHGVTSLFFSFFRLPRPDPLQ